MLRGRCEEAALGGKLLMWFKKRSPARSVRPLSQPYRSAGLEGQMCDGLSPLDFRRRGREGNPETHSNNSGTGPLHIESGQTRKRSWMASLCPEAIVYLARNLLGFQDVGGKRRSMRLWASDSGGRSCSTTNQTASRSMPR